ncbi:MAG: hypothetical protein KGJ57_09300 [Sphingomonadales bacterium]|nr:hypothetical protein [Sphingomonadales bacterium]MDE2169606.1 hypothetical protein [Sphingomonadales bacterium]
MASTPRPKLARRRKGRRGVNLLHLGIATRDASLAELFDSLSDPPIDLAPTPEGDETSEGRYENAEAFFPRLGPRLAPDMSDVYYKAGITAQLALSAHLLKVGFPDRWCAQRIGHRVAHSLAYANATGLDHRCPDMAHLAAALTPYWRWNGQSIHHYGSPKDPGFSVEEVSSLLRALLAQVRIVTGYELINDDLA